MPTSNLTSTAGSYWNLPNYIGELFVVGENKTPLLNAIGAKVTLGGSMGRMVRDFQFVLSNYMELEAGAQPAITETDSLTAPNPTTFVPNQSINVVQIFQRSISMSYAKLSGQDNLSGLTIHGEPKTIGDHYAEQVRMTLAQIAKDYEYSIINGLYNLPTAHDEAWKMRGLVQAITAGDMKKNASSAPLEKAFLNDVLRLMAPVSPLKDMVMICNAWQRQKISEIWAYAPEDRTYGGVSIQKILTDFCEIGVMYVPQMPTDKILILDMDFIKPVYLPVPKKGIVFKEELAKIGASDKEQIYAQLGIDYFHANNHGIIYGLTTS